MKRAWQRSIVSGMLILAGQAVITLGEVHGTPHFVPVLWAQVGAFILGCGEIIRRQWSDPVDQVSRETDKPD